MNNEESTLASRNGKVGRGGGMKKSVLTEIREPSGDVRR